jgi:hypothetical protein
MFQWLGNTFKGCWTADGYCSQGIGKQLENAQILAVSQWERRQNCPAAIGKKWQFPFIFSEVLLFCLCL